MRDGSRHWWVAWIAVVAMVTGCADTADDAPAPSAPPASYSRPTTVEHALGCDLESSATLDWSGWTGETEQESLDALLAQFPDVDSVQPWEGTGPDGMGQLWLLHAGGAGYGTALTFQQELDADGQAAWTSTIDRLCDPPRLLPPSPSS